MEPIYVTLGIMTLVSIIAGIMFLIDWWKERSLVKAQEKAVYDFVDKMDERNRR